VSVTAELLMQNHSLRRRVTELEELLLDFLKRDARIVKMIDDFLGAPPEQPREQAPHLKWTN